MAKKVKPLQARTLTLSELQLEVLSLTRKVRFQLRRAAHEPGMNDQEFIEQVISPLEMRIYADRDILKMKRQADK